MSDPNWGMLSKSQEDEETIEEAIARLIVAHNANTGPTSALTLDSTHFVIAYYPGSGASSYYGTAIIGTYTAVTSNTGAVFQLF